jgi:hypothetical protein
MNAAVHRIPDDIIRRVIQSSRLRRLVARADEKLTAFLEPGSGPSGGTAEMPAPWRGQAGSRFNRRAATPNTSPDF